MRTEVQTINYLNPNGFLFSIQKAPEITYYIQEVEIPSLTSNPALTENPLVLNKMPGEKVEFGDLQITFKVDEDMANYLALVRWMIGLTYPESFDMYRSFLQLDQNQNSNSELYKGYSDINLTILNSSNLPNKTFTFVDAFPTNIGTLQVSSRNTDVPYITCTASFAYTYWKVDPGVLPV